MGYSPWGCTESDTAEATWHTQPLPSLNYTSAFTDINMVSLKLEARVTGPFHFEKGISSEGGNDNPLQYSCLENSLDRGTWRTTVREVTSVFFSSCDSLVGDSLEFNQANRGSLCV